jgi:hypothetical protein
MKIETQVLRKKQQTMSFRGFRKIKKKMSINKSFYRISTTIEPIHILTMKKKSLNCLNVSHSGN